jgi:Xaa-Pro aminopeptidase
MNVDFEQRLDVGRLRQYRLGRAQAAMEAAGLGAPMEIKEGMVFALETYCPATDGRSAARIEEEVVVGPSGVEILTKFPAQDLDVTNPY